MEEIILHIGHGKTGTSYLQSCLALNRQKLLDIGIDYPEDRSFKSAKKGEITSGNPAQFFNNYLNIESIRILFPKSPLMKLKSWSLFKVIFLRIFNLAFLRFVS